MSKEKPTGLEHEVEDFTILSDLRGLNFYWFSWGSIYFFDFC